MSANPIDKNSTPKPTGSLEELFRHHLGEEAAVPPRPVLWDQIDNSLLIRQNETYRRRLAVTRWVAAASLLLATLAGTGWWSLRDSRLGGSEVATSDRAKTSEAGAATANGGATGNRGRLNNLSTQANQVAVSAAATKATTALPNDANGTSNRRSTADRGVDLATQAALATTSSHKSTGFGQAVAKRGLRENLTTSTSQAISSSTGTNMASNSARTNTGTMNTAATKATTNVFAARTTQTTTTNANTGLKGLARTAATPAITLAGSGVATTATATAVAATASVVASSGAGVVAAAGSSALAALTQASAVAIPEQVGLLAARSAALSVADLAALPKGLATLPLPAEPVAPATHRWHYGASYMAGVFNPNINFSRTGIAPEYDYNPALGSGSPALTEAAATQYRQNLRPGLSQRIALLATRHLTGHWSLSTGAEFSQASATSASAAAFVGEQVLDLGQSSTGRQHTTNFRYRMASIPVELRYTNPVKHGWSLYGHLGGVVSALLGVRSEVEDNPEATRTYSLISAGTPYRRVTSSLRGGMGAQFRSGTGNWALTLGPVAEIGLVSLNAHPVQSYFKQSHPYSFGLEAGIEFGR